MTLSELFRKGEEAGERAIIALEKMSDTPISPSERKHYQTGFVIGWVTLIRELRKSGIEIFSLEVK